MMGLDPKPRGPLEMPAYYKNTKDGQIMCKAHANSNCKSCCEWRVAYPPQSASFPSRYHTTPPPRLAHLPNRSGTLPQVHGTDPSRLEEDDRQASEGRIQGREEGAEEHLQLLGARR